MEKLKYILEEIKKADDINIKSYKDLNNYIIPKDNKYLYTIINNIIEIDEILSNLEISIEIMLEGNK